MVLPQTRNAWKKNHIDLTMSHVILDSLQAFLGLVLLGKKAKTRTVARTGGESGKKVVGAMGSRKPNLGLVEGGREDSGGPPISSLWSDMLCIDF